MNPEGVICQYQEFPLDASMDFCPGICSDCLWEHTAYRKSSMDNSAAICKLQALDGEQDAAQIGMIQ